MDTNTSVVTMPGPPLIGPMYRMLVDPLGLLTAARDKGPVVSLGKLRGRAVYMLSDPDRIGELFRDPTKSFRMTRDGDVLRALLGESVFTLEGERWRKRRRDVTPAYHGSAFSHLAHSTHGPIAAAQARIEVAARRGVTIELKPLLENLVENMIVRVMFGVERDLRIDDLRQAFHVSLRYRQRMRWAPLRLPSWVPDPGRKKFERALARLNAAMRGIIADREQAVASSGCTHDDLLSLLLGVGRYGEGKSFASEAVLCELKTAFSIGYVTTSSALTWVMTMLSMHPDVADEICQETCAVAGPDGQIRYEHLRKLERLDRAIKESLRLYPPGWIVTRRATRDTHLGDVAIPQGSVVLASQFATHRDPRWWPEPERFDPSRFSPEQTAERHRYVYFPFGSGPRFCIGQGLATMEIMMAVASLCRRFRFRRAVGERVVLEPLSTLTQRGMMQTHVELREAQPGTGWRPSAERAS